MATAMRPSGSRPLGSPESCLLKLLKLLESLNLRDICRGGSFLIFFICVLLLKSGLRFRLAKHLIFETTDAMSEGGDSPECRASTEYGSVRTLMKELLARSQRRYSAFVAGLLPNNIQEGEVIDSVLCGMANFDFR